MTGQIPSASFVPRRWLAYEQISVINFLTHKILNILLKFEDEMDQNEYLRSCLSPEKNQMRAATILGHLKSKAYSDSESIEKHIRGLTERFWRGKEKGLSDLCLLALSCLTSFIPRSREADTRI